MNDEQIVEIIDKLNDEIYLYRLALTKRYRLRRELRKQLEQNHRIIKPNI